MKQKYTIPKFFIGIILISLSVLGSVIMIHTHQFMKEESSTQESNSKTLTEREKMRDES